MNNGNYDKIIKIVLLGDANVGKSNIASRYFNNKFIQDSTSTIGVEFMVKKMTIGDNNYKIQLWDTAGQERFKSIVRSYYRCSHGIILVYDVTNKSSFNNIDKWLDDIKYNCNDTEIKLLLVGNKIDLVDDRQVSYQEGLEFAQKKSLDFIEVTSYNALNDNPSNINIMMNTMIKKIIGDGFNMDVEYNNNIMLNNYSTNDIIKNKKCCDK